MQAPGGKEEDTEGGFPYGGWQLPFFDDDDETLSEEIANAGALLIGRKTYDIFASYWPTVGKDVEEWGEFMNSIPKYVASKTLRKTEWQNSNLLEGDAAEAVAKLKREAGKDIYMFGSGDFIQTLMRHHLVDEYLLMIYPVVLGTGKRLFQQGSSKHDLELLKSKTTQTGVLVLKYKVKGGG
jgi:dihydrofolate reductase